MGDDSFEGLPRPLPVPRFLLPLGSLCLFLVLGASCTFERRPGVQVNGNAAVVDTASTAESASTFLQRFQAARSGRPRDLEALVRPGATVLLDGRALAFDAGEEPQAPGAWEILAEAPGVGGGGPQIADSAVFDESAVFVVRYRASSETVVVARDPTGWGVRLLHRVTVDGNDPGDP